MKTNKTIHYIYSNGETPCGLKINTHGKIDEIESGLFMDLDGDLFFTGTITGKIKTLDEVTCTKCIKELKKSVYHCEEHGFVESRYVTFDEKCDLCGRNV